MAFEIVPGVSSADVAPLAVIVMGDVVRLREQIRWFGELDEGQRPAIAHA